MTPLYNAEWRKAAKPKSKPSDNGKAQKGYLEFETELLKGAH